MTNWISEKREATAATVVLPADSHCWPASKEPQGEINSKRSTVQQESDSNLTAALPRTWNDGRYLHLKQQVQHNGGAFRKPAFYHLASWKH